MPSSTLTLTRWGSGSGPLAQPSAGWSHGLATAESGHAAGLVARAPARRSPCRMSIAPMPCLRRTMRTLPMARLERMTGRTAPTRRGTARQQTGYVSHLAMLSRTAWRLRRHHVMLVSGQNRSLSCGCISEPQASHGLIPQFVYSHTRSTMLAGSYMDIVVNRCISLHVHLKPPVFIVLTFLLILAGGPAAERGHGAAAGGLHGPLFADREADARRVQAPGHGPGCRHLRQRRAA